MDKITLRQMRFYAYHGVFAEENKLGQRYIVDLDMHLSLESAGQSDLLEYTVNYAEAYNLVKDIVENNQFKLIESLAEKITETLLAHYRVLSGIDVTVIKPNPPVPGDFEGVSVTLQRRR